MKCLLQTITKITQANKKKIILSSYTLKRLFKLNQITATERVGSNSLIYLQGETQFQKKKVDVKVWHNIF